MTKIGMLRRYISILMGELRAHRMLVLLAPHILGNDPLIQRHVPKNMPVPLGLTGSWGFFVFDA